MPSTYQQADAECGDHEPEETDQRARSTGVHQAAACSGAAATDAWLTDRLATRQRHFDTWAASAGVPADLDFTPESLDTVERLLRERVGSVEDLTNAEHDDFVQGAVWHLGEIARRHRDARWHYVRLNPDATDGPSSRANPFAGNPYVAQDPPSEAAAVPVLELRAALRTDKEGMLWDRFEEFD